VRPPLKGLGKKESPKRGFKRTGRTAHRSGCGKSGEKSRSACKGTTIVDLIGYGEERRCEVVCSATKVSERAVKTSHRERVLGKPSLGGNPVWEKGSKEKETRTPTRDGCEEIVRGGSYEN